MKRRNGTTAGGHTCPWWFIFTFDNPIRKLIHKPERILGPYVKSGDVVLDVGCGMGFFTIGLARLVGKDGRVIAADLQHQMLAGLRIRAKRAGVSERIDLRQSTRQEIGIDQPVDFALAFWMLHEVRQPEAFLHQIFDFLKPGGKFLFAEPYLHVSSRAFEENLHRASRVGFVLEDRPKIFASRGALFGK